MFLQADALSGEILESDICILGGGIAGITIATHLHASGKKIIILESGMFSPDAATQELYRGKSVGQPYDMMGTRLRWLGGTSNHWEGMCMQLAPSDMQQRSWVPLSGWPVSYNDLQPYYAKASTMLSLSDAPRSVPAIDSPDDTLEVKYWQFAKRLQFGMVFREELKQAENIRVVLGANVTNMKASPNARTIESAEVRSLVGAKFTVRAKTFILACGGIENARILLYSNDVVPTGLGNQNDVVGRYFMEHPQHHAATFYSFGTPSFLHAFRENVQWMQPMSNKQLPTAMFGLAPTAGAQEKYKMLNASVAIRSDAEEVKNSDPVLAYMQALAGKDDERVIASKFFVRAEQSPNIYSRVMLDPHAKDALGLPRAQLRWQMQDQDWQSIRTMLLLLGRHLPPGQGILRMEEWLRNGTVWPKNLGWGSHHMGTTRMGLDPKTSVVDADCKVHGMENLYIAGSSVFPTSGFANPTLTLMALAIKLTEKLHA